MKKILSKEQMFLLNEAAVDWNDSALGSLTKGILKPISWLKGSIKKGIKKQQINSLVNQWGLEYVKAIKAVDLPNETTDNETSNDKENKIELTEQEKQKFITSFSSVENDLKTLSENITEMKKWSNVDTKVNEYNTVKSNLKKIKALDLDLIKNALESVTINEDTKKIDIIINSVNDFISNVNKSTDIANFLSLLKGVQNYKKTVDGVFNQVFILQDIYELVIKELKDEKVVETKNTIKESFIVLEADFKLPTKLQDLLSQEDVDKLSNIEGIKEKVTAKLNLITLNTIKYEAEFIISNSKSSKDKEDNSSVLQRIWDKGILDTNNYFQNIVDTNLVNKKVSGKVDADIEKEIKSNQASLDGVQALGLNEVFPVGKKFDKTKIYAFQGTLTGQTNKTFKHILFMSPVAEFTEDINGQTFYWFKLLGSYKFDSKNNTVIRINPFLGSSTNKKMIQNFKNTENNYYVALTGLRPGVISNMFIYSNSGKYFFKQDIIEDVNTIKSDIEKYKKNNLKDSINIIKTDSNIFKFRTDQRFEVDSDEINAKKYPGVQEADGKADKGSDVAKSNHDKLLNILGK